MYSEKAEKIMVMEDIIEITWIFNQLSNSGRIRTLKEISDSRSVRDNIELISEAFEKKYEGVDWESSDLDYVEEIEAFATQRLLDYYRRPLPYELKHMIVISTAHICPGTAEWIDLHLSSLPAYKKGEYGWFIYPLRVTLDDNVPVDFAEIITFCKDDYDVLCLDQDADIIDCLPVYEW